MDSVSPEPTVGHVAYLELACRLLIGLTFGSAGISKLILRDRERFAQATRTLLPAGLQAFHRSAARAVLAGELAIGSLLIFPMTAVVGYTIASSLSLAFAAATISALRRGVHLPCACFGQREESLGATHVVRDGALLAVALTGLAGRLLGGTADRPAGAAIALVGGAAGAVLLIFLDDVVDLFRSGPGAWGSPAKEM